MRLDPDSYFAPDVLPEGAIFDDPSHLQAAQLDALWVHWRQRQYEGQLPIIFQKAKSGDIKTRERELPPRKQGDPDFASGDDSDDDSTNDGNHASTSKGKAKATSEQRLPQLPPHEASPCAHATDAVTKATFLVSLNSSPEFQELLERRRQPEPAGRPGPAPAPWTTWRYGLKYLPSAVHQAPFLVTATRLIRSAVKGHEEGVLGLGLLLREGHRAQEIEPDAETDAPPSLITASTFGTNAVEDALELLKKAMQDEDQNAEQDTEKTAGAVPARKVVTPLRLPRPEPRLIAASMHHPAPPLPPVAEAHPTGTSARDDIPIE